MVPFNKNKFWSEYSLESAPEFIESKSNLIAKILHKEFGNLDYFVEPLQVLLMSVADFEGRLESESYIDRHPGWIKLGVTLKEGSGVFFLSSKTSMLGNTYYIAWEEDNSSRSVMSLMKTKYNVLLEQDRKQFLERTRQLYAIIDDLITRGLFK